MPLLSSSCALAESEHVSNTHLLFCSYSSKKFLDILSSTCIDHPAPSKGGANIREEASTLYLSLSNTLFSHGFFNMVSTSNDKTLNFLATKIAPLDRCVLKMSLYALKLIYHGDF